MGNIPVLVGNLVFSSLVDVVPIAMQVPGQRYGFFLDVVSLLDLVTDAFTDYAVDMQTMHQAQKAGFKSSQAGKVGTSFKTILPGVLAKTDNYDISSPLPAVKHYAAFQNHSAGGCVKHKVEYFLDSFETTATQNIQLYFGGAPGVERLAKIMLFSSINWIRKLLAFMESFYLEVQKLGRPRMMSVGASPVPWFGLSS